MYFSAQQQEDIQYQTSIEVLGQCQMYGHITENDKCNSELEDMA